MKFEPANTQFVGLTLRFFDGCLTKPGINRPKWQQHVIIACRTGDEVVNRVGQMPLELATRINSKDYSGHAKLTVGIRNLIDGWGALIGFEIFCRRLIEDLGHGFMPLLIHLDMHVHIDR